MSLIVALYAIKLAARQTKSPKYSYGWQRAEILGALINGVFLLALCLSIFLEAVQRFFEPQGILAYALCSGLIASYFTTCVDSCGRQCRTRVESYWIGIIPRSWPRGSCTFKWE